MEAEMYVRRPCSDRVIVEFSHEGVDFHFVPLDGDVQYVRADRRHPTDRVSKSRFMAACDAAWAEFFFTDVHVPSVEILTDLALNGPWWRKTRHLRNPHQIMDPIRTMLRVYFKIPLAKKRLPAVIEEIAEQVAGVIRSQSARKGSQTRKVHKRGRLVRAVQAINRVKKSKEQKKQLKFRFQFSKAG